MDYTVIMIVLLVVADSFSLYAICKVNWSARSVVNKVFLTAALLLMLLVSNGIFIPQISSSLLIYFMALNALVTFSIAFYLLLKERDIVIFILPQICWAILSGAFSILIFINGINLGI